MLVWKVKDMTKRDKVLEIVKPNELELYLQKEQHGPLKNYSSEHCLNTDKALSKIERNNVTAFCFAGEQEVRLFVGYSDGLICY